MMLGYYIGGALLTLIAGIFVIALNSKDREDMFLNAGLLVVASLFWPIAWIILLVAGAAFKVKEMKEESSERRG